MDEERERERGFDVVKLTRFQSILLEVRELFATAQCSCYMNKRDDTCIHRDWCLALLAFIFAGGKTKRWLRSCFAESKINRFGANASNDLNNGES